MNALIKMALTIAESGVLRNDRSSLARLACIAMAIAVAVLSAIGAIVCLLAALWIYVMPHVGAVVAPVIVSGVLIIICFAVYALVIHKPKKYRSRPSSLNAAPTLLLTEATHLLKAHKVNVLIAALLAGLIAGKLEK